MKSYKVLTHNDTYNKTNRYLDNLKSGTAPGLYLQNQLQSTGLSQINPNKFLELIIRTKLPQIFAESAVYGDGSDWNQTELSILGDVNIAVPVTVFDNGNHYAPTIHDNPFEATLLFIPGALLSNGCGNTPADWNEVTKDGEIDLEGYYRLYERRLLPSFMYANEIAEKTGRKAVITIPGIGCGQFAGRFRGQLGSFLKTTLKSFLENHGNGLTNIRAVYFDPYRECDNERYEIDGISYLIRPLTKGNEEKSQLCRPEAYEDHDEEFASCDLFSIVAWDHVSWPGNDFYAGSRATDDGVKAAATDTMLKMTGIEGEYDTFFHQYDPPEDYANWADVVFKNQIQLVVADNCK